MGDRRGSGRTAEAEARTGRTETNGKRDAGSQREDTEPRRSERIVPRHAMFEMSGALADPSDDSGVPVGRRPLLPPNQQRRVRTDD